MRDREETSVFRVPTSPACRAGHRSTHYRPYPRHGRLGNDADASTLACDFIPPRSHRGSVRCHSSQAPPGVPSLNHRVTIRKQRPLQHSPAIWYHTAERTSSQFHRSESSFHVSPHPRRTSDIHQMSITPIVPSDHNQCLSHECNPQRNDPALRETLSQLPRCHQANT
jgi:hypothetical protein